MDISDLKGTVKLNNGIQMPYFGLGVYLSEDGNEVINAINWALETGYRLIDTAAFYHNEEGVGQAVRNSQVPREEIFVTTKVWNVDQGYEKTMAAFDVSMNKLGLDYLDLYLIHWPVAGKFKETWKALGELYQKGVIKAIGVSNFMQNHLEELMADCEVVPMVNQVEFHPHLVQQDLLDFCAKHKIQHQAWSPMMQGKIFQMKEFDRLREKYNKSIAQIVLRWNLQKGVATIPKSSNKDRIVSNADIFDFELSPADIAYIDALNQNLHYGPDPKNFNF